MENAQIGSETNEPEQNLKRLYELKLDNETYKLIIEIVSKDIILFKIRQTNFISFTFYSNKYNYESLIKHIKIEKNKYNDLTQVLELFDTLIQNDSVFIIKNNKRNGIELYLSKNENYIRENNYLFLERKIMAEKEMMNILIDEINEIKNKESNLVNNNVEIIKNNIKEDDINNIEKEMNKIDEEIVKMNQKKEKLKQKLNLIKGNRDLNKIEKNKEIKPKERKNEIEIQIQINDEDIDKEIFFLNKIKDSSPKNPEIYDSNINIDLYVNNIKYGFRRSFYFHKSGLFNITLIFKKNIKNCNYLFSYCDKIKSITFYSFNTQDVTDMSGMFFHCSNLTYLDLTSLKTYNVENMSKLFFGCENLKKINLSSFNTSNVVNMEKMFFGCYNIENLDLSSFDCQNVKDFANIFCDCYSLKKIKMNYCSLNLLNFANDEIIEIVDN